MTEAAQYGYGAEEWDQFPDETKDEIRSEAADRCPACGDLPDYCQGHGEIGDPDGHAVLAAHDEGHHDACHEAAGCDDGGCGCAGGKS